MQTPDLPDATARITAVALVPGWNIALDGVPAEILFDAGRGIFSLDLLPAFWREEATQLDWLTHFLCDPAFDLLLAHLANPPEEDLEADVMFSRSQLATLGSDVMDQY